MRLISRGKSAILRPCLALLCVAVLALPPNLLGDPITFTYNGGDHNYSDPTAWSCSPTCTSSAYPDTQFGSPIAAVINSGQPDNVLLDTPSTITSLGLGGSGVSAQSTLTVSGPSLTIGSGTGYGDTALAIGNGGVLNIDGGAVTLDLSAGALSSVDTNGQINVTNAGSLTLQYAVLGSSFIANNGSISVTGAGSSLKLVDSGSDNAAFSLQGYGSTNLSGGQISGTAGTETLRNEAGHTISGNGSITNLDLINVGNLAATGGTLSVSSLGTLTYGTLAGGGNYSVADGSILQLGAGDGSTLSVIGDSTGVTVNGSGLITQDGTTNALVNLTNVAGSLTLQNNASLTIDPSASSFQASGAYSSAVKLLNGSSLDVSQVTFGNVAQGNLTGNYEIGNNSTLTYNGPDIKYIDPSGSLTLDGNGHFVNTSPDANPGGLEATLGTVNGSLTLQNGATFTSTAGTFRADTASGNGSVSVLNGSTLDLTSTTWENESAGTLQFGNYEVGSDSTIKYTGNDISTIDTNASLTLDANGALVNTNSSNPNAVSNTLSTVNGALTLNQGANLTIGQSAGSFTVGAFDGTANGIVSLYGGSTLDVSAVGFGNEVGGHLTQGGFLIGDGSTLKYSGNDINTIDDGAVLYFQGSGKLLNGQDAHDAVSNTLSTVSGNLFVDQGANLTLSQAVTVNANSGNYNGIPSVYVTGASSLTFQNQITNNGSILVDSGSTLSAQNGFTNYSDEFSGAAGCGCGSAGSAEFALDASSATITNGLFNISNSGDSSQYPSSYIELTNGASLTTDTLTNKTTLSTLNGVESSYSSPQAGIDLYDGSSMIVTGDALNSATSTNGSSYSSAYISLDNQSTLTVGGKFTNDSSADYGSAELDLEAGSTATVSGLFSNLGDSLVDLDTYDGSGSTLNANGGFLNSNSTIQLSNASTLNVSLPTEIQPAGAQTQQTWAFQNVSDDSDGAYGNSNRALLQLGYQQNTASQGGLNSSTNSQQGPGAPVSTATITGGLLNSATSTNNGSSESDVNVDAASVLNADTVSNVATVDGSAGSASANINVRGGSTMTVTGALSNGQYVINGGTGSAGANVSVSDQNSLLSVGGGITNYNGNISAMFGGAIGVTGGGFQNTADDLNSPNSFGNAVTSLAYGASGSVVGGFTNSATSKTNGTAEADLTVDAGSTLTLDSLTNTAGNATGDAGSATAAVSVQQGSTLHVTGNVQNTFTPSGVGSGQAEVSVDASTMNVDGTFTNTAGFLNLQHQATVSVGGQFTNDVNSAVTLDHFFAAAQSQLAGSVLNTNGFGNDGVVNLNQQSTINNTGAFSNTGTVSLDGGSLLSIGPLMGQDADNNPIVVTPGSLTNTGTINTGTRAGGSNTINVTGDVFNTAPGVVNIAGQGDSMTVTGQFTNSGQLNVTGAAASVEAGSITNLKGGQISVTGIEETVSSDTGITNDAEGTITVQGGGNALKAENGTLSNAGSLTVGAGGSAVAQTIDQSGMLDIQADGHVQAGTFTQTDGHTTVETGGTLTATEVDLQGGTLSGGGSIYGNVVVDGGTLAPGDPQSIDIIGNYQQTLMGVLDLDFAGAGPGQYDSVNVQGDNTHNGDVTLAGALDLTLEAGFGEGIDIGTLFHILTWTGSLTGNFDTFNDETFSNGQQILTFQEVFGDHGLDLQVIAASVATPEPSTVSMLFGVLLLAGGMVWIRRRRARTAETME